MPDSAPTATAWSTGKKTIDARLSQGPSAAENIPGSNAGYRTTFEIADKRGMLVGNVSTAEITDATPAAPSAHMSQRACQGPADTRTICPTEAKGAGGLGSIAEQQVDHLLDVNLGGGRNRFLQTLDGSTKTVVDYAKSRGYRYVETASDLEGIGSLAKGPVLGLFTAGNMTTEFKPLLAATTPGAGSPTTRCDETNRPANEPSLEAMTRKASQIVPAGQDTPGFYATLQSADGVPIRVSYGTGKTPGGQTHTGARVPVAAIGPQATNVMGVRDQTDPVGRAAKPKRSRGDTPRDRLVHQRLKDRNFSAAIGRAVRAR